MNPKSKISLYLQQHARWIFDGLLDAAKKGDKEKFENLRAVLNAGAHYKGKVTRCVGKGSEQDVKDFTAFCPKAIAGIGWLADTVADRSIPIRMKRKLVSEKVERLHERTVEPIAAPLRKRLSDWIRQQLPALKDAEPDIPDELNDRQQDGAECLLAIADAAGGDWPEKARKATNAKDDDIEKAVAERLKKDEPLKESDIKVRSDNGVVTLSGKVPDGKVKTRAADLTRRVPGVKTVRNELESKS